MNKVDKVLTAIENIIGMIAYYILLAGCLLLIGYFCYRFLEAILK